MNEMIVRNECGVSKDKLYVKKSKFHGIEYESRVCCDFHSVFTPDKIIEKWEKQENDKRTSKFVGLFDGKADKVSQE